MANGFKGISVILVEDEPLAGGGFGALIRAQSGFQVLATSARSAEAVRSVRERKPDVVLLNLPQTGDDSLTLAGALHGEAPESRVVVLGVHASHPDLTSFVRAGVSGFVMADAPFGTLLEAIHTVAQGIQVLPPELTHSLFGQLQRRGVPGGSWRPLEIERLTNRQRLVADLIVRGFSNREIAGRLEVGLPTVKSHVRQVLSKLAVDSRLELAAFFRVRPDPVAASP